MQKQRTSFSAECAREAQVAFINNDEAVTLLRCAWLALQGGGAYLRNEQYLEATYGTIQIALGNLDRVSEALRTLQEDLDNA
ncbi:MULTISPECIES: hypothetical protein [unclassified Ensifer]|uniref:hypothetical protein n=1 Tax=unclassified Ensifer TaxID=2633371 RepID=UPI000715283A|nr:MULTISPECIES: hypothetical protein [unclassified Ensifer]KQX40894.1 hypothetical protein ASD49_15635 [Ensifer sp. Root1298]KQX70215.1 hypothetical protein ASD41_16710 [Ensifer sp. Root1312]KRC14455.1 hypothetical protein ASE29_17190 [Ensifer sp. Root74]